MVVTTGVEPSPPGVVLRYKLYEVALETAFHVNATCPVPAVAAMPVGATGTVGASTAASLEGVLPPEFDTAITR
mgnify:CR=1 FL=1